MVTLICTMVHGMVVYTTVYQPTYINKLPINRPQWPLLGIGVYEIWQAMVGQAMKWQQHTGLLPQGAKIDVFRGMAVHAVEEAGRVPTWHILEGCGKGMSHGISHHSESRAPSK